MLSERSSRALAGIRFPLVLMVLAMHVHPEALHTGPVFSPAATALTQLGFMAVPCFFLMSGYLFSGAWRTGTGRPAAGSCGAGCIPC